MAASDATREGSLRDAVAAIVMSRLFDPAWYAAQVGLTFPDERAAVEHFVAHAATMDASPHPLFEPRWVYPGGRWRRESPDPLSYYLDRLAAGEDRSPHPLLDSGSALNELADDSIVEVAVGRSMRYAELRAAALASLAGEAAPQPSRAAEVGVVVPVSPGLPRALWWLRQTWRGLDVEGGAADLVLIVDHPADLRTAVVTAVTLPGVRVVGAVAPDHPGPGHRETGADSPGNWGRVTGKLGPGHWETRAGSVVFVDPRLNVPPLESGVARWVSDLTAALDDETPGTIAVPLLIERDQTVVAAGAAYDADGSLRPLLRGATPDDAERMVRLAGAEVPAAWSYFRAETMGAQVSGAHESDSEPGARVVLAPSVRVVVPDGTSSQADPIGPSRDDIARVRELMAAAGYDADGRPALTVIEGRPALRWAIDIAAPLAARGRRWGDDIFARSLAAALEDLGQRVTIDHPETRGRANREYDDVVLTLRGLERVPVDRAASDALRLLWVISHPDEVSAEECAEHDLVFAAGSRWAAERSAAWATEIRALLQCTDAARFHPGIARPDSGPELVAVLNARGGPRPVVEHALAAGLPLTLYGDGWAGLVDDEVVAGIRVPNADLGALYASAGVVLADHWDDMRRLGFVSNRVFDVLACAGRLWVDDVAGLDEVLSGLRGGLDTTLVPRVGSTDEGDTVRVWRSAGDFTASRGDLRSDFPDLSARVAVAERVVTEHSFAARAAALLDAVLQRRL